MGSTTNISDCYICGTGTATACKSEYCQDMHQMLMKSGNPAAKKLLEGFGAEGNICIICNKGGGIPHPATGEPVCFMCSQSQFIKKMTTPRNEVGMCKTCGECGAVEGGNIDGCDDCDITYWFNGKVYHPDSMIHIGAETNGATCASCSKVISEDDIIGDGTNRGLCCVPDYYDEDYDEETFDAPTGYNESGPRPFYGNRRKMALDRWGNRRFIRRRKDGTYMKNVDVNRSLAMDRRRKSTTWAPAGFRDQGDGSPSLLIRLLDMFKGVDEVVLMAESDLMCDKHDDYCESCGCAAYNSETDAYIYAYNDGHTDARNQIGYKPTTSDREITSFKKIFKQAEGAGMSCEKCGMSFEQHDYSNPNMCWEKPRK
jgi:hypothetical protein